MVSLVSVILNKTNEDLTERFSSLPPEADLDLNNFQSLQKPKTAVKNKKKKLRSDSSHKMKIKRPSEPSENSSK
jgi:hypothetical protein